MEQNGALQPIWPDFTREVYGDRATKGQAKALYKLAAEGQLDVVRIGRRLFAIRGRTKARLLGDNGGAP